MYYNNWIKLMGILAVWVGFFNLTSCADELVTDVVDKSRYEVNEQAYAFLNNAQGLNKYMVDLYNAENENVSLCVRLTKPVAAVTNWRLRIDESLLSEYNKEHETDFQIFPPSLVSFRNGNVAMIKEGKQSSEPMQITLASDAGLKRGKTYILPVRVEPASKGVELSENNQVYYYVIKAQGDRVNPKKNPDVKIISCFGVDNENVLIHKELFLKHSGKPLFDIIVLFSGSFEFKAESKSVSININKEMSHILNNHDKYIKPLQDLGMKITLGFCNGGFVGCGTMEPETCRQFARDLKNFCDQYGLDGVFFDDEYGNPGTELPGFSQTSTTANASRLCYEVKKAMPDRLVMVFLWDRMSNLVAVDGKQPGEFVDYFLPNYHVNPGVKPGATMAQMGASSQELTGYQWYARNYGDLSVVNRSGYGATMVFSMGPYQEERQSGAWLPWSTQRKCLDIIARDVFNDELYWTGVAPRRDW